MWWLLLLAADEVGANAGSAPSSVAAGASARNAPRLSETTYDLGSRARGDHFRLGQFDAAAVPARRNRPLAVTAIDDERQRLVIGVKPGGSKNRLGFAYRLRLGR